MKTKHAFLLAIILTCLFTACNETDSFVGQYGTEVLTVQMPDKESTRATFSQIENSLDMRAEWQKGDKFKAFIVQGENVFELDDLAVFEINKAQAKVRLNYPGGVDKQQPFELYACYGREAYYSEETKGIALVGTNQLGIPLSKLKPALYAKASFKSSQDVQTLQFHHFGAYEVVHLTNNNDKEVTISNVYPADTESHTHLWGYQTARLLPESSWCYWPMTGKIAQGSRAYEAPEPEAITIKPGETAHIASWFLPNGKVYGQTNYEIIVRYDEEGKSKFSKPYHLKAEKGFVPEMGRTYHINAIWNGKNITFNDEEIELSATSLTTVPGSSETVKVYSTKSFKVASSNEKVATCSIEGNVITINAIEQGSAEINLINAEGQIASKIIVNVINMIDIENITFVDLDLPSGTLWATQNIGASAKDDPGSYYICGIPSANIAIDTWEQYFERLGISQKDISEKTCGTEVDPLSPYLKDSKLQGSQFDIATLLSNGLCQTPTKEQFEELRRYARCNWERKYKFQGEEFIGRNGNSIFLPTSGWGAYYWTSTVEKPDKFFVYGFNKMGPSEYYPHLRIKGAFIRPVAKRKKAKE